MATEAGQEAADRSDPQGDGENTALYCTFHSQLFTLVRCEMLPCACFFSPTLPYLAFLKYGCNF